jgi:LCP family protein required for cell wall assembly
MRNEWNISRSQVNLVSARSRSNTEMRKLSRSKSVDGYAQLCKKRIRKKRILAGTAITLISLLVAAAVGVGAYFIFINNALGTDSQGTSHDFNTGIYEGMLKEPEKPEDPFWMLLMGTDNREGYELPRADTIILVRVDQQAKRMALISIPRDLYVEIPGYSHDKINASYALAEMEESGSGPAATIRAVQAFAGVDIAYFAQVDFDGLVQLVDALGGVEVDVPVDIIGDVYLGGIDVYAGLQVLDGAHALAFCRSRDFDASDYQRQANQRTFLQALARQILSSDLPTIATTMTSVADMTFSNMDLAKIIKIAQGMQGMQESSMYTYYVPSSPDWIGEVSYVVADEYAWQEMVSALNAGIYPEHQEDYWAGVVPDGYLPSSVDPAPDQLGGQASGVNTSDYTIDVRNGYGTPRAATSISDMLVLAGYKKGTIDNANSFVYDTTLIIYGDETSRAAAEDIRRRLGCGKIIASQGRYAFTGHVLVVAGGDFPVPSR